jgi:hypothetical protein
MRSDRRFLLLPLVVALPVLAFLTRSSLGETIEGSAFSTVLAIGGGLALGACVVLALGARRSRA